MALCNRHTNWMSQWLTCCFMFILFHFEKKRLLMRNLATFLPLSPNCLENFSVPIDGSIKMLKNSWIFETKQRSKQRAALKKLFSVPPDKSFLRLWNKIFLTGTYRNIQTFTFQLLRECSSWEAINGVVQMFFSDINEKHFCWKICKMSKASGSVAGLHFLKCWVSWGS